MDISALIQEFHKKYSPSIENLGLHLMAGFKFIEKGSSEKPAISVTICSDDPIPEAVKQQIEGKLIPGSYQFQKYDPLKVEIKYSSIPKAL